MIFHDMIILARNGMDMMNEINGWIVYIFALLLFLMCLCVFALLVYSLFFVDIRMIWFGAVG